MVGGHKRIQGSLAGGSNPIYEMPTLLNLHQVNDGYTTCSRARTSAG
jgi:Zn-dependent alcohol dehydrogenase